MTFILTLPAVLDAGTAKAVAQQMEQAVRDGVARAAGQATMQPTERGPHTVWLDATALQRFDSSALAVMLACRRAALAAGWAFAVRGMSARLQSLARMYGVAELLEEASDRATA